MGAAEPEFDAFVDRVRPGLVRALSGQLAPDAVSDAVAEAFAYAWEHWSRVRELANPGGYLFRVAQSRSRSRRAAFLAPPAPASGPDLDPALIAAVQSLPMRQRAAVWLVHACGWNYAEAAEAMGISTSAVGTHLSRGMAQLRSRLGVTAGE